MTEAAESEPEPEHRRWRKTLLVYYCGLRTFPASGFCRSREGRGRVTGPTNR